MQEADRRASDSPDVAYYKYLRGFFLIMQVLETRAFLPIDPSQRLQDSKTRELFGMAFEVLRKGGGMAWKCT